MQTTGALPGYADTWFPILVCAADHRVLTRCGGLGENYAKVTLLMGLGDSVVDAVLLD